MGTPGNFIGGRGAPLQAVPPCRELTAFTQ